MSDTFVEKDNRNEVEAQSHSKTILDVKSSNLSERALPDSRIVTSRKIYSAIRIESNVNYDDLCGPWVYPKNRVYSRYKEPPSPSVCIWQYFTKQDVDYLKKYQKNKEIVLFFFENKFAKECKTKSNDILLYELWEFFKFARLHSFRGKSISAVLGLVYLMHLFFLSHPWRSAKEIYEFFHEATLLHTVLNPPKSLEVFSITESNLLLKAFHEICMKNLVLLRILCHKNYRLIMNLRNPASLADQDE